MGLVLVLLGESWFTWMSSWFDSWFNEVVLQRKATIKRKTISGSVWIGSIWGWVLLGLPISGVGLGIGSGHSVPVQVNFGWSINI